MEQITAVFQNLPPEILEKLNQNTGLSYEEIEQRKCDDYNKIPGKLAGYDCLGCLNRGHSMILKDGCIVTRECHCMDIRRSITRIEKSGLSGMLETCTFANYQATEDWQVLLKQSAINYVDDNQGKWFFAGGQVGSGKTHICTAIVGELLKQGKSARYMLWRDEVVQLKACVTDDVQYARLINPLKTVDVLYIDDLFKTARGVNGRAKPPTDGDLNVAFELINHRYNNKNLVTIISCEHYTDDLMDIDEAVGSRIYQMTKEYCNLIARDNCRNYRMR